MKPGILSLGSINADFQFRTAQALGSAETMAASELSRLSGGKAANVAWLARRLGHPAALLGLVGEDDLAAQALGSLAKAGVDMSGLRRTRSAGTAVSVIAVPPTGKKAIMLAGEANLAFTEADITAVAQSVQQAPGGSVLVCDYEVTPAAASAALRAAASRGIKVVVDPSFPKAVPQDDLRLVHALTPNEEEALALANMPGDDHAVATLTEAARRLAARGPAVVCIKRADGGTLVWTGDEVLEIEAAPVDVVDTTGAGDAFTGAFAVALLEGRTPREAALFATAASEVAVTAFGSQPAYPDRARLDAQLASAQRRVITHRAAQ